MLKYPFFVVGSLDKIKSTIIISIIRLCTKI